MDETPPYTGKEKLVIAFDLGATQSAVSFVHLIPGLVPQVRFVNRWPGQEEAASHSKTPTLVCYENGRATAFGAEAANRDSHDAQLAKWFKLHLNPKTLRVAGRFSNFPYLEELPPLPRNVPLAKVYSDFFRYLFEHTRHFFKSTVPDGPAIWARLQDAIDFAIATPNGWDDVQQGFLTKAVVQAGILHHKFDKERLSFVTESEASIHSVLHHQSKSGWLVQGDLIALLDAGGATVDTTLYRVMFSSPKLVLEEVVASECVQAGSVFVDLEAEKMLRLSLAGSKFGGDDFIQEIMSVFERKTKRQFEGTEAISILKFGRESDNDKDYGVIRGRLSLTQAEVKSTFEASLTRVLNSTRKLLGNPNKRVKYLLLVGGYGACPYLQNFLKEAWEPSGVKLVALDDTGHKAAAEGAAMWMIKRLVTARAARATYGVFRSRRFDETSAAHQARAHLAYVNRRRSGSWSLPGGLHPWIKKGEVIPETHKSPFSYTLKWTSFDRAISDLASFRIEILAYDGDDEVEWVFDLQGKLMPGIRRLCILDVDLSSLRQSLHETVRSDGSKLWQLSFTISVLFGGTSLCASFQSIQGDLINEGPVAVIPVD